jgi:hypothetical protein
MSEEMQGNLFEDKPKKEISLNTKTGKVLQHLKRCGKITSWEAITLYRATRLSGIIYNLKEYGYDITCVKMKGKDGAYYGKYVLQSYK